jgi:hypothetical protein
MRGPTTPVTGELSRHSRRCFTQFPVMIASELSSMMKRYPSSSASEIPALFPPAYPRLAVLRMSRKLLLPFMSRARSSSGELLSTTIISGFSTSQSEIFARVSSVGPELFQFRRMTASSGVGSLRSFNTKCVSFSMI